MAEDGAVFVNDGGWNTTLTGPPGDVKEELQALEHDLASFTASPRRTP